MRVQHTLIISAAASIIVGITWYTSSFHSKDWSSLSAPTATTSSSPSPSSHPSQSEEESQIDRLLEVIRAKNDEINHQQQLYKELEEKKNAELEEKSKKLKEVEAEKESQKKKEAEENSKKEAQKKEKEKEEAERNKLSDAFWTIREQLSQKEADILKPIEIPREDRPGLTDKNDKLLPNGNQILLLSAFDYKEHDENNLTSKVMSNREEYCNYHGYTHYFINTTRYKRDDELKRSPVWWKLPALRDTFEKNPEAEWIWWVDYDIIITNELIDLAEHLLNPYVLKEKLTYGSPVNSLGDKFSGLRVPDKGTVDIDNIDIILTQDYFGINAGSFFIRKSAFSNFLLDVWEDKFYIDKHWLREEQDAFIYLYQNHKVVFDRTGIVPQRAMNAYHNYKVKTGTWQEGDLAIHFAGPSTKRGQQFLDAFEKYWNLRIRVPEEHRVN